MKCFSLIRRKAEIRRFWNTPNVETPLDNRLIFSRGKSKRIKVVSGGSSRGPSCKMSARSYSNSTIIEKLIRIRVIRIETTNDLLIRRIHSKNHGNDKPGNAIILAIFIKRNVDFSENRIFWEIYSRKSKGLFHSFEIWRKRDVD